MGATPASSNAYLSTSTNKATRPPDLVLQPCKEGVDFTLRLLAANRMATVVELQCDFGKSKTHSLTEQDIKDLFQALGSSEDGDSDDEEDHHGAQQKIQEEYRRNYDVIKTGGLPHLQALSIQCTSATDNTPSFITALTSFLCRSGSFQQFTHLTMNGVNLRGSAYDLRGLAESFRLHPRVRYVQMTSCWFTKEQQADMPALQQVFKEQEQKGAREARSSSSQLKFGKDASSGVMYAPPAASDNNGLRFRAAGKSNAYVRETEQETEADNREETWWGEKILSFFCMFCPVNKK